MANEFNVKKGLIVTGSAFISNDVTASAFTLEGSGQNLLLDDGTTVATSSISGEASVPDGTVSGSSQLTSSYDSRYLDWELITGSYTASEGGRYIAASDSLVVFTLPETNNTKPIRVAGSGSGGWQINVPTNWDITFVDEVITGNLQSTVITDSVELLCVGNNSYNVISSIGNITFNNL